MMKYLLSKDSLILACCLAWAAPSLGSASCSWEDLELDQKRLNGTIEDVYEGHPSLVQFAGDEAEGCAMTLKAKHGEQSVSARFRKRSWNPFLPLVFSFEIGGRSEEYCVKRGSIWTIENAYNMSPDHIIHMRRLDQDDGTELTLSARRDFTAKDIFRKTGFQPMKCRGE